MVNAEASLGGVLVSKAFLVKKEKYPTGPPELFRCWQIHQKHHSGHLRSCLLVPTISHSLTFRRSQTSEISLVKISFEIKTKFSSDVHIPEAAAQR